MRGLKSDSAVLCTDNESFELKEAETSNSLLLLPECQFTAQSLSRCTQPSVVNRQVHSLSYSLGYSLFYSPGYSLGHSLSYSLSYSSSYALVYSLDHSLSYSLSYSLIKLTS